MVEDDETQEKENGNFQETNELLCGKLTDKKYKSNHLNDWVATKGEMLCSDYGQRIIAI